ncbi:NADP-dependent dehydrogenase [Capsaspora owczarzaki ATCC 30864]|uniref:NADP-dependent dehydrogenase n=1 Tax=Capsaspora owczarzaki (strain ATCC 30864) TaxID=595528 RepID=A0A0D2UJA9_CAPO3|nr:NADP-dependent dehydrogenase [Capsaspora owczarzaki ATCC 30864]KJE95171.1 NADP-dependent dehydrogenase [Capsaspora owczarzaki ATCC 30864]|eukprot:XP_004346323.1 NADP-dependent dehydrogenase [Capsaspora owczarzaki ATCC 30864]
MSQQRINRRWLYVQRPAHESTAEHYQLDETTPAPTPADGELLIQAVWFSVDPYMRIQQSSFRTWEAPHPLNTVQGGGVVGVVVESRSPAFAPGDYVSAYTGWQLYATVAASAVRKLNPKDAPIEYSLGVLGMPGRTAYFGLLDAGKPKAGETVVVSAASGAVGLLVAQIAKIQKCRVVGIAGGQEKCNYLKSLGLDEVIDYKALPRSKDDVDYDAILAALKQACPQGVDIYFDNVGGTTTDAVFNLINLRARVIICGQITQYNGKLDSVEMGPRFLHRLIYTRATIQGILARDYVDRMDEMLPVMIDWLNSGKLKYEQTVVDGFEQLPSALNALFHGKNVGKMLVRA